MCISDWSSDVCASDLSAPGDVEEALRVETTEVAGVEPAVLQRLGIGLGIVVVAGEDGGAAHADLALLAGRQALAGCVLDGDLHAGSRIAAGAERHGVVVETVQLAWQQNGRAAWRGRVGADG